MQQFAEQLSLQTAVFFHIMARAYLEVIHMHYIMAGCPVCGPITVHAYGWREGGILLHHGGGYPLCVYIAMHATLYLIVPITS